MQKITPFLWFDREAEEAANFYVSIFSNSRVVSVSHYGEGAPMPKGTVMSVNLELEGQEFMALNGGPGVFSFTGAISFYVSCADQTEVNKIWDKFAEEGEIQQCGWIKDKYGVYWQIIPDMLGEMLNDPDPEKAQRVMQAMLKMKKIETAELQKAYDNN